METTPNNDPIVTLSDGTQMPKSKVPVGTVYINEKGMKVRKVLKPTTPPEPKPEDNSLFSKISAAASVAGSFIGDTAASVGSSVASAASSAADTVSSAAKSVGNSAVEFATGMIVKLLQGLDIDSFLSATEEYGKKNGKDVKSTVNFLNKLKSLRDGK